MRKILDHLGSFPGAPSIDMAPNNDNSNSNTSASFTFTTFTASALAGTATSYSWSITGSSGGTFGFSGGSTSATCVPTVSSVAAGATATATLNLSAVVNGITVTDTGNLSYQNTTPAYTPAIYPVSNFTSFAYGVNVATTGPVITWPTPHQTDDVMYLLVYTSNQTIATPTGCTVIYSGTGGGTAATADSIRASVFYRRATSGAQSNITLADAGDYTGYRWFVLRGVDTTGNGLDTFASTNQTTATTTFTMPGITTSVNNAFILSLFGLGDDSTIPTATANASLADPGFGYVKGGNYFGSTVGADSASAHYYGVDTVAGTVSATSWSALSTTTRYEGVTLAVAPQNPPPTATFTSFNGITCPSSEIGTSQAVFTLQTNGIYTGPVSNETYCSWAGVLSDYEVLVTVSGSGGSFTGTTGTYQALTANRTWMLTNSSGLDNTVTRTLQVTIRHATTLSVVINSASVTLSAESLSDPIGGGIAGIVGVFL